MPLSLRALSEIRCVGSVLIAIMDQGYEVECSWILPKIITRKSHKLDEVYAAHSFILRCSARRSLTSAALRKACLTPIFAKPIVSVSLFEPGCCLRVQTRG